MSEHLDASPLAPGLLLGEAVELAEGVKLGANVIIHARSKLAAGVLIQDAAVIGKSPKLRARSSAPKLAGEPANVDENAAILTGAVIFAGARIGSGATVGDYARVRERARIGPESLVGGGSTVDNDVVIGAGVSIQTNCYVTAYSEIEDEVFVGPGVITTNDDTMSRHPPGATPRGARLRRACRVGAGAVLCPGVEIGEEAFIAAGAVVTRDVPARTVMMGVPARQVREVPEGDLVEHWR